MRTSSNALLSLSLFVATASAHNPLVNYHYLADPNGLVFDDKFWIIADLDDESVTGYNIKAYYALSSKDMVNWTDHGEVFRVPRDVPWAGAAWAPGAAVKNGKVYVYFPNGTGGVGVITAPSPEGPYVDPLGKALITSKECDGVAWCFDPGAFVDDDGKAYLIYGGGSNDKYTYGSNLRMVELNDDMKSYKGSVIRLTGTTNSLEAAYITKRNGKYYLSYNARGQSIKYCMGDKPTGPYKCDDKIVLENPHINGKNINASNNNHHSFVEYKDKWYAVYHDRRVAIANNDKNAGLHRSISIDVLEYNNDGTFKKLVFTDEGPAQIENFDPYDSIPALTSSLQKNIRSRTDYVKGKVVTHVLTPKSTKGAYIRVSGVDFGGGAISFIADAASIADGNKIEIRTGSEIGTLAGTCNLAKTGNWQSYENTECEVSGLKGVVDQLFLVFKGNADSTMGIRSWRFSGTPSTPQEPYGGAAATLPGKIEVENYDEGGARKAYYDMDSENKGKVYREDGVDIEEIKCDGEASGKCYGIGYTQVGEWLEYTVNVATAGEYFLTLRAAAGGNSGSVLLFVDDKVITDTIAIPQTADNDWSVYKNVSAGKVKLDAGEHILKIAITGSYANIDWINIDEEIKEPEEKFNTIALQSNNRSTTEIYEVFDLNGNMLGQIKANGINEARTLIKNVIHSTGIYCIKSRTTQTIHRLAITK